MQPMALDAVAADPAMVDSLEPSLAALIGQREFDRWFRGRTRLSVSGQAVAVHAATPMHLALIERRFGGALLRWARQILAPSASVRFAVDSALAVPRAPRPGAPGATPCGASPAVERPAAARGPGPDAPPPGASAQRDGHAARGRAPRRLADFSEFVAGSCNELALGAARRFCETPLGAAAPLYLFGPIGTGKTHLLEGICRQLRRTRGEVNVLLLTSEEFTNHFTAALRGHSLPSFRQRFRTADALLVDDVDFFDGKRGVQEEFLHTLKQLEATGKLMAFTADRHPRLFSKTCEELKTRYLSGMFCRIEPPSLETRRGFALAKARWLQCDLSPDVLEHVCQRPWPSLRELEGVLQSLALLQQVSGRRVSLGAARRAVLELERDALRPVRLPDVERAVCELFGVREEDLRSPSRSKAISTPRMLAMYLARRHTGAAYSEIGSYFGGRNHATVISAEKKVAAAINQRGCLKLAASTVQFADLVERLEQQLRVG